jgi:GntR family transcriptional regulator/MocR family aminotransferase
VREAWATSSGDLHLDLDERPTRAALESALRDAVRTGRLPVGGRLPSSRALAADLGLARNTVTEVYAQLVAEGWLVARQGSGTRVADRPLPPIAPVVARPDSAATVRHDLRAGTPDLASFPRTAWSTSVRRTLTRAGNDVFGYPQPQGRLELRQALAEYLARARGVRVAPERLVVCSGFAHGLSALMLVLRRRGARAVAMERFGHQSHRGLVTAAGLRVHGVPVDAHGAVLDGLGEVDAVVLTTAHQFPWGGALSPERRAQAVRWAVERDAVVVDDDYDGEFRYDRRPVGAVQALAPEHVVYAGTASKSLAPGLRLGWLVLPAHLVDDVAAAVTTASPSTLDQLALADFISSGSYDRHVRRQRLVYRRRRDRLVAAVRRAAPEVSISGVAAGLHAVLELPHGWDESAVVAAAAERGLAVDGMTRFEAPPSSRRPALVVGFGTPPDHAFSAAVARLCAVLSEHRQREPARRHPGSPLD